MLGAGGGSGGGAGRSCSALRGEIGKVEAQEWGRPEYRGAVARPALLIELALDGNTAVCSGTQRIKSLGHIREPGQHKCPF